MGGVSFVNPWLAAAAAGLSIPVLVLLYMLKLRRERVYLASTLLWSMTHRDLQVNVPFQRLRLTMLFILHALILLILVLLIARPVIDAAAPGSSRVVLLVDTSASMNVAVVDGDEDASSDEQGSTRLDVARRTASNIIENLLATQDDAQVMLVSFARTPRVLCSFTSDARRLEDGLQLLTPTDEFADLQAALHLAGAYASQAEGTSVTPPRVMILSDGGVTGAKDGGGFTLRTGEAQFVAIIAPDQELLDEEIHNIGIVATGARRRFDDPAQVDVFVRLAHTGDEPRDVLVSLQSERNGAVGGTTVRLPASKADEPGEASTTLTIEQPDDDQLTIHVNANDALAADDTAALILPAPQRPRIALVHGQSMDDIPARLLNDLLEVYEPASLEHFDATTSLATIGSLEDRFDLVLFDRVQGHRLPALGSLTIGGVPAGLETYEPKTDGGQRLLSWDRQHPLMRHVSLDSVVYRGFGGMSLPRGGTALATGPGGPVVTTLRRDGAEHVVVGLDALDERQTNWSLDVGFSIFMLNALEYLTAGRAGRDAQVWRAGDLITVQRRDNTDTIDIRQGTMFSESVATQSRRSITLPHLARVGVYEINGAKMARDQIAIAMLSEVETDIRPRRDVMINAQSRQAVEAERTVPRDLWPWLAGAALVLLVIEWIIWTWQMSRS